MIIWENELVGNEVPARGEARATARGSLPRGSTAAARDAWAAAAWLDDCRARFAHLHSEAPSHVGTNFIHHQLAKIAKISEIHINL